MAGAAPSVDQRAANAALWSIGGYTLSQAIRLAGNLILTRLLFPEAFGLMAIVVVLLTGLELFSDVGFRPSIVQNPRGDDPLFLNTAWTFQILRGLLLASACVLIAIPAGRFYAQPQLTPLLCAAAVSPLMAGFASVNLLTASRHLRLRALTLLEVAAQLAALATTVVWASISPSVWALISGHVAVNLVRMVLSHLLLPGPSSRIRWERDAVRELFSFGKWIFVSTLFTFPANEGDRLIFAKLIPLDVLGVYSISVLIAAVPVTALRRVIMDVVFPACSRVHLEGGDLSSAFERYRRPLLVLAGCIATGVVVCGPAGIRFLYDPRYAEAGWMLQILGAAIWFRALEGVNSALMLTVGQPRWVAAGHAAKAISILAVIPAGFFAGGFVGAVAGYAATELIRYGVSVAAVRSHGFRTIALDLRLGALTAAGAGVGLGVLALAALGSEQALIELLVGGVVSIGVWSPLLLSSARAFMRQSQGQERS